MTLREIRAAGFIPGSQAVTEALIRRKLESEGHLNIQVVRQGRFFEAMAARDGATGKLKVDAATGRLADDDDDDQRAGLKTSVKTDPPVGRASTRTAPPCAFMIPATMARPSPAP